MQLLRSWWPWAAVAVALAVLRYPLKGWLDPLGVPVWLGSLFASQWVLLGLALVAFFGAQGRAVAGRYTRAVPRFLLLAAWCEALVIAGILVTDAFGADSYYCGPFEAVRENFPTGGEHAVGHLGGFLPRAVIWLLLGGVVYGIARRGRGR